jgi:aspartyl-tRNA synthetase
MFRSHRPDEITEKLVGNEVTLSGWVDSRRDHGGIIFFDLRDSSGIVQIVVDPSQEVLSIAQECKSEFVIKVVGEVRLRPDGTKNDDLSTGDVEVVATGLEILNPSEPLPFQLKDAQNQNVDELLRLEYRFFDIRTQRMQKNLITRSKINQAIRNSFANEGCVEIETPMLVAATPEGARDFIVPARLNKGKFYSLPQSPQLFKQMLVIGGVDKYFQICKCLRDEDLRADRQFEFTQLDFEMAFPTEDEIYNIIEKSVCNAVEALGLPRPQKFARMTWFEAIDTYGVDRPDLRFGMKLIDAKAVFKNTDFRAFQAESLKAMVVKEAATYTRSQLDGLIEEAKKLGAKGLVWIKVTDAGIDSPVAKFINETEGKELLEVTNAQIGDLILMVADIWKTSCEVLGELRVKIGRPKMDPEVTEFLWVTEFPLFEGITSDNNVIPSHHPFTSPHIDDIDKLDSLADLENSNWNNDNIYQIRSRAYDLICNGWELGSGSIRIHEKALQNKIFNLLGMSEEEANEKFGFLLKAFSYGAPPHGGFAYGIDRLTAILCGEENIREVIAYPRTQSGQDPLSKSPSEVSKSVLEELGIEFSKDEKDA